MYLVTLNIVFSTPSSVFGYPDETRSLVFDILHQATKRGHQCMDSLNQLTIETTISRVKFAVT